MLKNISPAVRSWLFIYAALFLIYSVVSFGLTTPNLILLNTAWFESFQFFMWQQLYNNRSLLSLVFGSIFLALIICFLRIVSLCKKRQTISTKQQILLILALSAPLLFSYNALSADVFNYIFNSRMVLLYQANPHIQTAQEFSHDLWTRFMHNVHTAAPYGYGWTGLSLLPYLLGGGKFIITWFNFRLFSLLSLLLTSVAAAKTHLLLFKTDLKFKHWALFFLNPLVLIEVVSNSHNDLWMMLPALVGLNFLLTARRSEKQLKIKFAVLSLLLWAASVGIKLASLALLPVYLLLLLIIFWPKQFAGVKKPKLASLKKLKLAGVKRSTFEKIKKLTKNKLSLAVKPEYLILQAYLMLLASMLMFLPLFTTRSQQFHPWYLTWPLVFLPVIKNKIWQLTLLAFSFTSLFRYLPWLYYQDYSPQVLSQQKIITWSALAIPLIFVAGRLVLKKFISVDRLKIKSLMTTD